MLRFKQFLLEAPSVEDQIASVRRNTSETALSFAPGVNLNKDNVRKIDTTTTIGPAEAFGRLQVIGNPSFDPENPNTLGGYHSDDRTAVVYGTENPMLSPSVLEHEITHHDQDMRQTMGGRKTQGEQIIRTSPGIDPEGNYQGPAGADPNRPLAYPEYSYRDVEVNARKIPTAISAGDDFLVKLHMELKNVDPNDTAKIQEIQNKIRAQTMETHMASERANSASNIRTVLDAEGPGMTPERRQAAMKATMDAAEKAERKTTEAIAREMQTQETKMKPYSLGVGNEYKPPVTTEPTPATTKPSAPKTPPTPSQTTKPAPQMVGTEVNPQVQTMMASSPLAVADFGMGMGGELPTQLRNKPDAAATSPYFSDEEQRDARARVAGLSSESGMEYNQNDPNAQRIAAQREKDRQEEQRRKAEPKAQGPQQTPVPVS